MQMRHIVCYKCDKCVVSLHQQTKIITFKIKTMKNFATYNVDKFLSATQIKKHNLQNAVCFHSLNADKKSEYLQIENNPDVRIKHVGNGKYRVIKSKI